MAKNIWSEKNKKIFAGGAVALFCIVLFYEFVLSGSPPPTRPAQLGAARPGPTPAVTPTAKAAPQPAPRPDSPSAKDALLQQQLSDTSPLNLGSLHQAVAGAETERGSIFGYFVPTPTPPPPPPPPPPILLRGLQPQTAVAGSPRNITLVVVGDHFPPDAQIIYGGMPRPTKKAEGALTTEIAASDYAMARSVPIEVKSQSKPAEFYSNQLAFVIQPPPQIPFKMVGRIGDLAVLEFPGTPNKEYSRYRKGDTVQGFHIDSMDATGIDVTDMAYGIKRRVALEEKH